MTQPNEDEVVDMDELQKSQEVLDETVIEEESDEEPDADIDADDDIVEDDTDELEGDLSDA